MRVEAKDGLNDIIPTTDSAHVVYSNSGIVTFNLRTPNQHLHKARAHFLILIFALAV